MRVLRPALLLVAVAACAWFVVGAREAHEVDQATNVVEAGAHTPAQLRSADSELRSAAFLNPDREVDILRGRVAIDEHRLSQARQILAGVVDAEPENLNGWIWFTGANLGRPAAREGTAHLARLDPQDARQFSH
jgi:hypothetical protein